MSSQSIARELRASWAFIERCAEEKRLMAVVKRFVAKITLRRASKKRASFIFRSGSHFSKIFSCIGKVKS